jgi:hypothetical protein
MSSDGQRVTEKIPYLIEPSVEGINYFDCFGVGNWNFVGSNPEYTTIFLMTVQDVAMKRPFDGSLKLPDRRDAGEKRPWYSR